ncbi:PrpR N-terminal domain-containing protein [Alkalihalobacillus sp. BA299]|uniref:PrpR N-terminal domain-containing protein n=1 Tax=Alkalihalobacillus sp. BA299 TaxID=2815938 RepID=UPI001ADBB010|nr:sigma-54-dependent Fis family transcriptional regulator [Alkalihalobacillus sp. BA299]
MIKVLFIAPYEGLVEMIKELDKEIHDFELHTELGNLNEGVKIARKVEEKGFNIIISRGGTASMIQEVVSIPVVEIQVSGYDVLRTLTLVKGFPGKAAIVGFPNITHGAATICNLLDFEMNTITIKKETEVTERLKKLKEQGYEVVIGDVITVQAAQKLGLNGILITSGKEAIQEALEEARRVYRLFSRLHEDVLLYQSIIDNDDRAIAIMSKEGKVIYRNKRLKKEFTTAQLENLSDITEVVRLTAQKKETQTKFLTMDDDLWKLMTFPTKEVVLLYFDKVYDHGEKVSEENGNPYAIDIKTSVPYILIAGKSEPIQNVLQQVEDFSQMDEPIWIISEKGNGKELVAQSIYLKNKTNDELFITIYCDLLKHEQLKKLIQEGFFQKHTNDFIYLKGIDQLDHFMQKEFYYFLKNQDVKMPRWLISSEDTIEQKVKDGLFDQDLYHLLSRLIIYIPPLRERQKDIENLVHVFISEFHIKYGNQVVGIRQDALKELEKFDWPGNIQQLKQIVEQLVLQSSSFYIEKDEVEVVLKRIKYKQKQDGVSKYNINLNGTLEDIEKQIISIVLEEEEMNQSKAAKRLGINRSTLWRKLK